ncbi:MAG TPA: hypothetical protein PKW35_04785, partial [Nannocystaceae bacterium]|nr:hypothetical protein [Nannocystaceae bacterium]
MASSGGLAVGTMVWAAVSTTTGSAGRCGVSGVVVWRSAALGIEGVVGEEAGGGGVGHQPGAARAGIQ